jgi:hypothetical protein
MQQTIDGITYDTAASTLIQTRVEPAPRLGHCTLVTLYESESGHFLHSTTGHRRLIGQPTADHQQSITPLTDAQANAWKQRIAFRAQPAALAA